MKPEIRKIVTYDEEVLVEGFRPAEIPWRMFAVAAVITNPWAGRYVEDLKPEIHAYGPVLGKMMTDRMIALAGSGDAIEAYGKAAVVGLNGEVEHASGIIHTLRFGNHYRQAVSAKSYLAFTNTRGPANAPIMVPLMDKNDAGKALSLPDRSILDPGRTARRRNCRRAGGGNLGQTASPYRRPVSGSQGFGS